MAVSLSDPSSLIAAFRSGFAPPPATTIDEWAEACRYLPTETSADAGPWRNAKTPWLVPAMRAASPGSPYQIIVLMTAARVGKTEVINNTVGFYMDCVRCPIMVAQPIEADAEEWSKDHLDPMIAYTPTLAKLVTPDKDRKKGNTILHKKYTGGGVYVVGANSGKSFRRRTIRVGAGDEIDAWPGEIAGEGDPWLLFLARQATFTYSRKAIAASTPTVMGASRIERLYESSNQGVWEARCPHCGLFQELLFSRLQYDPAIRDQRGNIVVEYLCDPEIGGCGALLPEYMRDGMVARGQFRARFPERLIFGLQVSQLIPSWVTWSEIVEAYIAAGENQQDLQVFTNTRLGRPYDATAADAWDPDGLMSLREVIDVLPAHVVVITASVDTQGDRLVLQVDAWGPGEERWTLEREDIMGDPTADPNKPGSVWAELDHALLTRRYPHALGGSLRIRAVCVDTGGHASVQAYKFCRARKSRRVWPIKGDSGREGTKLWPSTPSRKNKGNVPLYLIGVFAGKSAITSRLRSSLLARQRGEGGGPGHWHFAARDNIGPAYFEELTSETCITDYASTRGGRATSERRRRWVLRRSDLKNEALDCSVYSYAALHGLMALGLRLERPPRPSHDIAPPMIATPTPAISSRPMDLTKQEKMPPAPRPEPTRAKRPRWEP